MEKPLPMACVESRWKTYLLAVALLVPGFVVWSLSVVFFAPKIQEIWKAAGAADPDTQWVMDTVMFLVRHGGLIVGVLAAGLLLAEIRPARWSRYRRVAISLIMVLLNTAIVGGIWLMCLASLLVVPALVKAK